MGLFVHGASANGAADCLKEHQKSAMDKVGAGDDVCDVFQEQLDCFENVQQCKGMLPVVKQASQQAGGDKCNFKCGKTAETPSRLRSGAKSSELQTCTQVFRRKQQAKSRMQLVILRKPKNCLKKTFASFTKNN